MNRKRIAGLGIVLLIGLFVATGHAESLLGKDYVGGDFGIIKFGDKDTDEALGLAYGIDAGVNFGLNQNMEWGLFAMYSWADGEHDGTKSSASGTGVGADLCCFFKLKEEKVNPYVSCRLDVIRSEAKASNARASDSEDSTDVGFGGKVGVEIELTDRVLLDLDIGYFYIDDDGDTDVDADIGYWFTKRIFASVGTSYEFDEGNVGASIGINVML